MVGGVRGGGGGGRRAKVSFIFSGNEGERKKKGGGGEEGEVVKMKNNNSDSVFCELELKNLKCCNLLLPRHAPHSALSTHTHFSIPLDPPPTTAMLHRAVHTEPKKSSSFSPLSGCCCCSLGTCRNPPHPENRPLFWSLSYSCA